LELSKNEFASQVKKLIQRKSIHWRYEKEVRVLWSLAGLTREHDRHNQILYFTKIPSEMITEVILGYRCNRNSDDPNLEKTVRDLIRENKLNVQLNRAEPSDSRFGVTFRSARSCREMAKI